MQNILVCRIILKYISLKKRYVQKNICTKLCHEFIGRWLNGKPHGSGKLEWSDGRTYAGQFHKGIIHGTGKMEIPMQGVYEGQWKDGQQNGYGTMK